MLEATFAEGERKGRLEAMREEEIEWEVEMLLRLLKRAKITLAEDEPPRI